MSRKLICYPESISASDIAADLMRLGYNEILNSSWSGPLDKLSNNQAILFDEINVVLVNRFHDDLEYKSFDYLNLVEREIRLDQKEFLKKQIDQKKPNNWGLQRIGLPVNTYQTNIINVGIIDTGVDCSHEVFYDKQIIHKSFISDTAQDLNGHGTFCAALAYGKSTKEGLRIGIAPDTNIFSCKILNEIGVGSQGDIIRGIIWCIRKKCKVINLSIGYSNIINKKNDEPITRLIKFALNNDCMVVCPVGNGSDRGDENLIKPIMFPASCDGAIAVTAIDSSDGILYSANRAEEDIGQIIHFSAPGVAIYSAWSSDSDDDETYRVEEGTSYATAYVSGVLTLYRQKFPEKNAEEIKEEALRNIEPFIKCFSDFPKRDYGFGIVNID